MKQNVSEYDFIDAFMKIRPDNFSRNGLQCLYDYLIEFEDGTGEEIELDVIALCCDFTEYESLDDCNEQTGYAYRDIDEVAADSVVITEYDGDRFIAQDF